MFLVDMNNLIKKYCADQQEIVAISHNLFMADTVWTAQFYDRA